MIAVANNKYVDDERGIVVEAVGCMGKPLECLGCIYEDRILERCTKPETVPDCLSVDEKDSFIFIKK